MVASFAYAFYAFSQDDKNGYALTWLCQNWFLTKLENYICVDGPPKFHPSTKSVSPQARWNVSIGQNIDQTSRAPRGVETFQ